MDAKLKASIEKQIENPDWEKIETLAEKKQQELNGIISKEGAIHIVLKDLYPDYTVKMPSNGGNEIKGRLINKTKPRVVETKKSGNTVIRDVFIATEEAGVLKATLWGKQRVELFAEINHNDPVILKGVKIGAKDGESYLNFFDNSTVEKVDDKEVKPMDEMLEGIDFDSVTKSKIGTVEGLIIQVTEKEYKTCPICNGSLSEVEGTFLCKKDGEVKPETKKAVEVVISNKNNPAMQTMLWPEQLQEVDTAPKAMDKIKAVCRVYDKNYFIRESTRNNSDLSEEVLMKQHPKNLRMTVYSFELTPTQTATTASDDKDPAPIPVEKIEDANN